MDKSKVHEDLHRLVDALPVKQAVIVKRLIEALVEETDEEDSEALSADEQTALERGRKDAANGETVDWRVLREELRREV